MTPRTLVYLLVVVLAAACGLAVEITAGRLIAPYLGMSLYTWTAIIAVVLAGFSAGHWIGGRMSEAPAEAVRQRTAWALILAALSTLVSLVLLRVASGPILAAGLAPVPTILALTSVLFFLPSLFVGVPSPALTKLAIEDDPARMGRTLGLFYAGGALGSIGGTLATGYLFISWLGSMRTLIVVAVAYAAMGMLLLALGRRTRPGAVALLAGGAAAAAIVAGGTRVSAFVSNCTVESDYYCIRIVDVSADVGAEANVLVLDHLGHGINLKDDPLRLVTPYADAQDMLARIHSGRRSPFRSFFIGGGGYTLPRAWLAARPDAEITVAEIDPAVTDAAVDGMWLVRDPRLTILHQDARRALAAEPEGRFDLIVGDAFHDIAVPPHLVTREFFGLVRSRIADDGVYLMNVVDRNDRPRLALSVAASLAPFFPHVEIWELSPAEERTTFVIAAVPEPSPLDRLPLRGGGDGDHFERLPQALVTRLTTELAPFALTDDYAPVDRLIGVQ